MSARSEYLVSYAVIIIGVLLMAFFSGSPTRWTTRLSINAI